MDIKIWIKKNASSPFLKNTYIKQTENGSDIRKVDMHENDSTDRDGFFGKSLPELEFDDDQCGFLEEGALPVYSPW